MKQMTTTAAEMSVTKSEGEPRQRGNRATRVPEILEISISSFASEGYAAFNQRRVASGPGIRLSTLQHYSRASAFAIELWSLAEHEDFARDLLEEMIGQNQKIFAGQVSGIDPSAPYTAATGLG